MCLFLLSLFSLTSSKAIYALCDSGADADECVASVTPDLKETGDVVTGKLLTSSSIDISTIPATDRLIIIGGTNAAATITLSAAWPATIKEIVVYSPNSNSVDTISITLTAAISVDYVCSKNSKIIFSQLVTTKTLELKDSGAIDKTNIVLASSDVPKLIMEGSKTADIELTYIAGKTTVGDIEIKGHKLNLEFSKVTSTYGLKISVAVGVTLDGAILTLNLAKIESRISFIIDNTVQAAAKITLKVIAKEYKYRPTINNANKVPFTVVDTKDNLVDQYPFSATSYAICIATCTAYYNDNVTLFITAADNTELQKIFTDIKSNAKKITIVSNTAIDSTATIELDPIISKTNDVIILGEGTTAPEFNIIIGVAAASSNLELKSLTLYNVALTITTSTTKTVTIKEGLELIGPSSIIASKVTYDGILSCPLDSISSISLKKINKLHASIEIDGATNLEFIDDGYTYGPNTIKFSDTAAAGIFSVTEFNLTTQLSQKKSLNVKAGSSLKKIRSLVINVTKPIEQPDEEEPEQQAHKLLADNPLLLEIKFDDTWKEVKGGEEVVTLITAYSPTKGTVTFDSKNLDAKFTAKEEPKEGGTPPPTPKDDGLSAGAIAGIVIACIAVVAGICVGVFFYIKKSKTKVGGAAQP